VVFLKLALVVLATVCALALFTYGWVVARTPGQWFAGKNQGATGIDITAVSVLTLRSPLYWLFALAILAVAIWLCRRWVLAP
jgi:hypothetical protein